MTDIRLTQEVVHSLYATSPSIRLTQEVVQALYTTDPAIRLTQEVVHAVYATDPATRLYQQFVEVLYTIESTKTLIVDISGSVTAGADLSLPTLKANITATGTLVGNITGIWQFTANITGEGTLTADLLSLVELTAAITATGDISLADLRENIEYLDSGVGTTGDITTAAMNVPWHGGSSLELTDSASAALVLTRSLESDLNLQQNLELIFGQRALDASNTILFTQQVSVIRVLPVASASNTLALTQNLVEYREAESYLNLQQQVIGVIHYIDVSAASVLNLTETVSKAGTVFNLAASNQLNLTHLVDWDQIQEQSASNTIQFNQNAFAVALGLKKYVLLQAPFNLIQTSVILPNPLLDDNESLISNLTLRRSMNGTPRTYVKTSKNRRLRYTFTMNRLKALELEGFCKAYNGTTIKMLNWKGEIWKVKLITNPIDFVQTRRYEPGGDRTDVNLEFEGVKLNG